MPGFKPNKCKINRMNDTLLLCAAAALGLFNVSLILFTVLDPLETIFLGSIIPPPFMPLPIKFVLLAGHAYLITYAIVGNAIQSGVVILYSFYFAPLYIHEIRLGLKPSKYRTVNLLRTKGSNIRHAYRALQLLNKHSQFYGPYLLVLNATFMYASITISFVLVRYWGNLRLFAKVPLVAGLLLSLIAWTGVMEFGRRLFSKGKKVFASWRGDKWGSQTENKVMKKFRLSCSPLLLSYGTQFALKKGSLLVFYRGVVRGLFRSLLTTKR